MLEKAYVSVVIPELSIHPFMLVFFDERISRWAVCFASKKAQKNEKLKKFHNFQKFKAAKVRKETFMDMKGECPSFLLQSACWQQQPI